MEMQIANVDGFVNKRGRRGANTEVAGTGPVLRSGKTILGPCAAVRF
jgi:hypothetical protein